MTHAVHTTQHPGLASVFDAFAAKAVADFPQLAGRFSIYDAMTDTLHGSFDDAQAEALLAFQRAEAKRYLKEGEQGSQACAGKADNGYQLYYFGINTDADEIRLVLDHELGHLVAPGGYIGGKHTRSFHEYVAETFSCICQLQKGHSIGKFVEAVSAATAANLLLEGRAFRFYLPVLQQLDRLSAAHDLSGLTPQQTANLAYRLSFLYAPSEKDLRKLAKIFAPVRQENKKPDGWPEMECARIMFEDHGSLSRLVFITGKAFLEPVLNRRHDLLPGWTDADFKAYEGVFWDSIREKIGVRDRQENATSLANRLDREIRDHMALGLFDKTADRPIDPEAYESVKNLRRLQRTADVYRAIRYFQETGKEIPQKKIKPVSIPAVAKLRGRNIAALAQPEAIALARAIAADPALKTPAFKASRSSRHAR